MVFQKKKPPCPLSHTPMNFIEKLLSLRKKFRTDVETATCVHDATTSEILKKPSSFDVSSEGSSSRVSRR
jgi:hypothetical protein